MVESGEMCDSSWLYMKESMPPRFSVTKDNGPTAIPTLSVGFVLAPGFTLLAFAGFLDSLRLAADKDDRSRQRLCRWQLMSSDGKAVTSSSGVAVSTHSAFCDPAKFDYVVVVGGVLHAIQRDTRSVEEYLRRAASMNVSLIGICTGSFILARAGLMRGRTSCVSWFHLEEFVAEFPDLSVTSSDQFLIDRDRITCAGGTSTIHLASYLIDRHYGQGRAAKGLRIMLEDGWRCPATPQPSPSLARKQMPNHPRVRRALLLMEQRLACPFAISALARDLSTTPRSLQRCFAKELKMTPLRAYNTLRMDAVRQLVTGTDLALCEISAQFGFTSGSQLSQRFRQFFGESPSAARKRLRIEMLAATDSGGPTPQGAALTTSPMPHIV
jgi:transcriptional regulator GlxA family with amidase domain